MGGSKLYSSGLANQLKPLLALTLTIAAVLTAQNSVAKNGTTDGAEGATQSTPNQNSAAPLAAIQEWITHTQLHRDKQWLNILFYNNASYDHQKSFIQNAEHFLASNGRSDSAAELKATLEAFFTGTIPAGHLVPAACQYPARLRWALRNTPLSSWGFHAPSCPEYDRFQRQFDIESVSFVFADYYLGASSSFFGHSFLRIHNHSPKLNPLLLTPDNIESADQVINFEAKTPDDVGAVTLIYNGISGKFPAYFSQLPMSSKIHDYSELDGRHMWNYELNFSEDDKHMLLDIFWELRDARFDYYFFSENCSYHMLSLLEAVNPSLRLRDTLPAWTLPSATIRAATENLGYVKSIRFRPRTKDSEIPDMVEREGPHVGHQGIRAGVFAGYSGNDFRYANYSFRLGTHSLDDPVKGYLPGFEIAAVEAEVAHDWRAHHAELELLRLIKIESAIAGPYFRFGPAWLFDVGLKRMTSSGTCSSCLVSYFELGLGKTLRISRSAQLVGLLRTNAFGGSGLQNSKVKAKFESSLGVVFYMSSRTTLSSDSQYTLLGPDSLTWLHQASFSFALRPDFAIAAKFLKTQANEEYLVGAHLYF